MVQSLMYCAEQIVIPEKFQNILKTYAKGKFAAMCGGVRLQKKMKNKICIQYLFEHVYADRTFFSGRKSINMILRIFLVDRFRCVYLYSNIIKYMQKICVSIERNLGKIWKSVSIMVYLFIYKKLFNGCIGDVVKYVSIFYVVLNHHQERSLK